MWYDGGMDGGTNVNAVDLSKDEDLLRTQWVEDQGAVMRILAGLQRSGWTVTRHGLMTEGDNGPIVARPMKIMGQTRYTGVGYWRINPATFDN